MHANATFSKMFNDVRSCDFCFFDIVCKDIYLLILKYKFISRMWILVSYYLQTAGVSSIDWFF